MGAIREVEMQTDGVVDQPQGDDHLDEADVVSLLLGRRELSLTDEHGVTHREGMIGVPITFCNAIMTQRWSLKPRPVTCLVCAT